MLVVLPVVLDDQAAVWVVEIGPPDEVAGGVANVGLDAGSWKSRSDHLHSQARLHRRLGSRICTTAPLSLLIPFFPACVCTLSPRFDRLARPARCAMCN